MSALCMGQRNQDAVMTDAPIESFREEFALSMGQRLKRAMMDAPTTSSQKEFALGTGPRNIVGSS